MKRPESLCCAAVWLCTNVKLRLVAPTAPLPSCLPLPQSGFLSLLYSIGSKPLSIWGSEGVHARHARACHPSSWAAAPGRADPQHPTPGRPRRITSLAKVSGLLPAPAVENGHIKRVTDEDIQSSVLEVAGPNVSTAYITCPADPAKTLGIKLPFLVMIVKNMNKYFTFEVQVRRRSQRGCGRGSTVVCMRPGCTALWTAL